MDCYQGEKGNNSLSPAPEGKKKSNNAWTAVEEGYGKFKE